MEACGSTAEGASDASSPSTTQGHRPLDFSREIAWCRAQEASQASPLVVDPYAEALAATAPQNKRPVPDAATYAQHVAATKYIDEVLINVMDATSVNTINEGDYRQVVLLGDGFDTRPFRLLWPQGTVIFLVAPSECHELAEAVLKQAGAKVPRGCLLRRVNTDLKRPDPSFATELLAAGFRGDRVSAWALQGLSPLGLRSSQLGLSALGLRTSQLASLLVDVSSLAAFHSLVLGELPAMERSDADNLLADAGLLGTTVPLDGPKTSFRQCIASEAGASDAGGAGSGASAPHAHVWLFSTQQMRLSDAQMSTHRAYSEEFEGLDEDFMDNVS
ncbi:hypothetical protein FOA52_010093 [Chlamydomonas sp. UWO 241]|nr:hypothetical protein FOA52_010093 [Chlamydomonas sp. UWO 241]